MSDLSELVNRSLSEGTAAAFTDRLEQQADRLQKLVAQGEFENHDFALGMEMEVYAVEQSPYRLTLAALPEQIFEGPAAKELGLHNAELNTDPDRLDGQGLDAQATALESALEATREAAQTEGLDIVCDSLWVGPPAVGSQSYLSAVTQTDGVTVATNMRQDPRYVAIDNAVQTHAGGSVELDVPGVQQEFPTILFESLASSIQPHLQIPDTETFPDHYNTAIRTLGPVLALATNSPFLPPDLYNDLDQPVTLPDRTHHELRIDIFEQSVNASPNPKVRVPRDITDTAEIFERIVKDDVYAPFLREWLTDETRETLAERTWEFQHKHGTYWRWLRAVVGGDPVTNAGDEYSLRIEYRPLPTQPTVRDTIGMQALTAGLIRGLVAADHPLTELPWERAEESFYHAVRNGLDATLAWQTEDNERTTDSDVIFEEMFRYARKGLAESGVSVETRDRFLDPLEQRWQHQLTPSIWKVEQVRAALDAGAPLDAAIEQMQRRYHDQSLAHTTFAEWF